MSDVRDAGAGLPLGSAGLVRAGPDAERLRVERIAREAASAFQELETARRGVSVFGSAREEMVERWGSLAGRVAHGLAAAGFTVITGGGPGLMAVANAAARAAGGESIGLTIELPEVEPPNPHLTRRVHFHYFFLRKLSFVRYSCAFVLLPGGFGTMDELFEALNLRRTHRISPFPVILVGRAYWGGLLDWLATAAVGQGALRDADLSDLVLTDDANEVLAIVSECHRELCRRLEMAP